MTTERSTYQPGTPCWFELGVPDPAAAKRFYGALLGWDFEDYPNRYAVGQVRGKAVAGINPDDPGGEPDRWAVYFATDDLDGTVKRAVDAGATVVNPLVELPDRGRYAILRDPEGAAFRLWEGSAWHGAELMSEHGATTWFELRTSDTARAAEFYRSVLERDIDPLGIPGFDYLVIKESAGKPVAGLFGVPGEPARWTGYFSVSDTDAAVARATDAGAELRDGPQDSPRGRLAWLVDPFGAEVAVISPPPSGGGR